MPGLGRLKDDDLIEGLDLWYLKRSGLWEILNHYRENGEHGKIAKLWRVIILLGGLPDYLSAVLSPFFSENLEETISALLTPLTTIQVLTKFSILWAYAGSLGQLMELFKKDFEDSLPPHKREGARKIMNAYARRATMIGTVCAYLNGSICVIWDLIPIIRSRLVSEYLGLKIAISRDHNTILSFRYPYMDQSPYYECYYVYELFSCGLGAFGVTLLEALAAQFIMMLTGRFEVLEYLLKEEDASPFSNEPPHDQDTTLLLIYVKEHQKLLKIGELLRAALDFPISILLATGMFILIIAIFDFFMGSGNGDHILMFKFFTYTSYPLVEVIIYCIAGSELEDASSNVIFAAYGSEWYKKDMEFRKLLLLLMTRSQNSVTVVAGRMSPVNHQVLTSILQMSYSTSMFMAKMTSEE